MPVVRKASMIFLLAFATAVCSEEFTLSFKELTAKLSSEKRVLFGATFLKPNPHLICVRAGKHIRDEQPDVLLYDLDKKEFVETPQGLNCSGFMSPDRKKFAYQLKGDIYILDFVSSKSSRVTETGNVWGRLVWKNNRELFFNASRAIHIIDIINRGSRELLTGTGSYAVQDFAPEGEQLFFSLNPPGTGAAYWEFYQADFKEGRLGSSKRITNEKILGEGMFSVTGDGKYMAVAGGPELSLPLGIYIVELKTGKLLHFSEKDWSTSYVEINADGSALLAWSLHLDKNDKSPHRVRYTRLKKLFAGGAIALSSPSPSPAQ